MTPDDLVRGAALARTRRSATLLLIAVAVLLASTYAMGDATWVAYLRSAAEAGVIGGLADWFAVVALFRHPLGVPIPHTAIIPTSKDGLGRSMAQFVAQNFLDPGLVVERIRASAVSKRVAEWFSDQSHADTAARHIGSVITAVTTASDRIDGKVDEIVLSHLAEAPIAAVTGKALGQMVDEGVHRPLVSATLTGIHRVLAENRVFMRRRLGSESPWWVPETIDDAVFDRAWEIVTRLLDEVESDEQHELRRILDDRLREIARRLVDDPEFADSFRSSLIEMMGRSEIRSAINSTWDSAVAALGADHDRIRDAMVALGRRIASDPDLQGRIDTWLEGLARPLAAGGQREIEAIISLTIERWDAEETSRRLELWMGRDLQFVRINGTLVGALIGLILHTSVELLT